MPSALITGITGQDGSYLAEQLLERGYRVVGLYRRLSSENRWRIRHLLDRIELACVDLLDTGSLIRVIADARPDEIYNLAAQSFVPTSWEQPLLTGEVTGLGAVRLLESVRIAHPSARVYQASTSEMYGAADGEAQDESTHFLPLSPYACAKLYAHRMAVNYREAYGMFVCCGILFNHESPRRGPEFVTRKVAIAAARIHLGLQDHLEMGALSPKRDWGFAGDYTRAMQLMLQHDTPREFVVGTGQTHSVQQLLEAAFAVIDRDWRDYVSQDPALVRPNEVKYLRADPSLAREELGWSPEVGFDELISMMVEAEIARIRSGEVAL